MYRFSKVIVSILALVFLAACAIVTVPKKVVTTRLDGGVPADKISASIHTVAKKLRWITSDISDNVIRAKLNARGHEVVVDIKYDVKHYEIHYVSSKNMSYNKSRNTIHSKYNKWINRLDTNIQRHLPISSVKL
jgi:hypothetical protein